MIAGKKSKKLNEMMIEAGYSESSARQGMRVFAGIKEELSDVASEFKGIRDSIIEAVKKKDFNEQTFNDLIRALTALTDKIELLSGRATDRTENLMPSLERQKKLDEELNEMKKKTGNKT